jgi:predicted negative regulator of RcsB-dependent stress response
MLTVNSLRETIGVLEDSKSKLLVSLQEARDQLKQQKADQADIYYYLNKKCDESFEVIASLEEQLLNEQSDREISEKGYESKLEELRIQSSNTEAKLHAKISDLESRLHKITDEIVLLK